MLRCSPAAFFQDDMQTLVASGTLVAEELEGGLGYLIEHWKSEEDHTIVPTVGSLSVGNGEALRVGYFQVGSSDLVRMNFCSPTTDGLVKARYLTYYMTFTVGSTEFKAEMIMPENTDTDMSFSNYTATVPGLYAALDATRTATIRLDSPDTSCKE